MSTFGELQNDVDGLPRINVSDYERIFKVHTADVDGKNFYYYNILHKIDFPDDIDANYIDTYQVEAAMPLTTLAYRIYGNIKMWWILHLMNKAIFKASMFVVPTGAVVRFIKPVALPLVYGQITKQTIYNGRHF